MGLTVGINLYYSQTNSASMPLLSILSLINLYYCGGDVDRTSQSLRVWYAVDLRGIADQVGSTFDHINTFRFDDVRINKIEVKKIYYSNTVYMLFYKRWKRLKAIGLVPMDATFWVSWGEGIETPYSTCSSWRPLSIAQYLNLLNVSPTSMELKLMYFKYTYFKSETYLYIIYIYVFISTKHPYL